MKLPTLYVVTDIETTIKKRMAFDVAWRIIDKSGWVYGKGSYIVKEAFAIDVPFYREKFGYYFEDVYNHLITPASIIEIRAEYNKQVKALIDNGHRVILCAYNARFDFTELPKTLRILLDDDSARWMEFPIELLDIWQFWGESVPLHYTAEASASGKFLSTSAESAYRFEFCQADFIERHMAWHDCEIEAGILIRALARKKKKPIFKNPADFPGAVWQTINKRLGYDGKTKMPPGYVAPSESQGELLAA